MDTHERKKRWCVGSCSMKNLKSLGCRLLQRTKTSGCYKEKEPKTKLYFWIGHKISHSKPAKYRNQIQKWGEKKTDQKKKILLKIICLVLIRVRHPELRPKMGFVKPEWPLSPEIQSYHGWFNQTCVSDVMKFPPGVSEITHSKARTKRLTLTSEQQSHSIYQISAFKRNCMCIYKLCFLHL